jgi:hypothetical protein
MSRVALLTLLVTSASIGQAMAAPRMTALDPEKHGFRFGNAFENDVIPEVDFKTDGLCGGMSYAVLDYYFAHQPIPSQDYLPANRTPLQSYIYNREVDSVKASLARWAELGFNPGGARNGEFFRWGLETKPGSRIAELRSFIDRGVPVVLGLQAARSGNHQVIAIGYDMGRYEGNLGAHQEDFKIFVLDPDYPNTTKILVPDLARQVWRLQDHESDGWQAYFVDGSYKPKTPPAAANRTYPKDGKVYELLLDFRTGKDDLRGGNDNVDVTVNLNDGTQQIFRNVNLGAHWMRHHDEVVSLVLKRPVPPALIRSLVISTTFGGGMGGDNWDMSWLHVRAVGGNINDAEFAKASGHRFTGHDKQLVVPVSAPAPLPAGSVDRLALTFRTGDDDLRGGNDNINVEITFQDGVTQLFENVNRSVRWADNTSRTVTLTLNRAVPPSKLKRIKLSTTFRGGMGGDNWNMRSVQVRAVGGPIDQVVASHGDKWFTGSDQTLVLTGAP